MSTWKRFWIGGGGALLPLLTTLLAIDLASIIDHAREFSIGIYLGVAIRYTLLFVLGGVVAALNSDEKKPIKLVQLGIAAPALIASYVNAQSPKALPNEANSVTLSQPLHTSHLALVAPAMATETRVVITDARRPQQVGFFDDVLRGVTSNLAVPSVNSNSLAAARAAHQSALEAATAAQKAAADAAAAHQQSPNQAAASAKASADSAADAAKRAATNSARVLDALGDTETR